MVESGRGKIYFKQLAINYCNKTNQKALTNYIIEEKSKLNQ